jgi:hypothetical protein
MNTIDMILMILPVASYIGLIICVKTGKIVNILTLSIVTVAVVILGILPISIIKPINIDASDPHQWFFNILAILYIGAMIYGAIGARTGSMKRIVIGGAIVVSICLFSFYI